MNTQYTIEVKSDWLTNELYLSGWYHTGEKIYDKEHLTVQRAAIDTLIEQLQQHKQALDTMDAEYLEYMEQEDMRMAEDDRNQVDMSVMY